MIINKTYLAVIGLLSLMVIQSSYAQLPRVKDDPQSRMEFELMKLRDPATGQIPRGIRQFEKEFMTRTNFETARYMQERRAQSSASGLIQDPHWIHRGPFNVGGRTRALEVDVNDEDIILAGGVSGGLWRTEDGGDTWSKRTNPSDLQSITCLAQDTRDGQTHVWYYGTGETSGNSAGGDGAPYYGNGIYKSTDGGVSWEVLTSTNQGDSTRYDNEFDYVHEVQVNPANGDVWAATGSGIYTSSNGGETFSESLAGQGFSDIEITASGTLYAYASGGGTQARIYRSTNSGRNWNAISEHNIQNGSRMVLAAASSDEGILYVLGGPGGYGAQETLWKYDNGDWSNLSANLPSFGGQTGNFNSQRNYNLCLAVSPSDPDLVVVGGLNLYRSTNGFSSANATTWIGGYTARNNSYATYSNHHPDQHAFVFLSDNQAICGNDGGVYKTEDITDNTSNGRSETVDWVKLNNGYVTTQVYAVSTGVGDRIIAGFQDNGSWTTPVTDGTQDWSEAFSGDGGYSDFSDDGLTRFVSTQYASIYKLTFSNINSESYTSFREITPVGGYQNTLFITPFYLDPDDDNVMYLAGDTDLFVNTDLANSSSTAGWKSIPLTGSNVSEIGVCSGDRVYAGTSDGRVFRIDNPSSNNPNVTDITGSGFPGGSVYNNAYVSSIGVDPEDNNRLLVAFSNYRVQSVFYSNNGGNSWTAVGGNLEENADGSGSGPSVRVARIHDGRYYVGTSAGLYAASSLDGNNTIWEQQGASGMGSVVVSHMAVAEDGSLVVGTHGNGVYSSKQDTDLRLEVERLENPNDGDYSEVQDVVVTLLNATVVDMNNYSLTLYLDGEEVVKDDLEESIASGDTYRHTFSEQIDVSDPGQYTIKIVVEVTDPTDVESYTFEKTISSQAAPTDIQLSNSSLIGGRPRNTVVGEFTTTDKDDGDNVHRYRLVGGVGSDNNNLFRINGRSLRTQRIVAAREEPYSIRVRTFDDDDLRFTKVFKITVTPEERGLAPTGISLTNNIIGVSPAIGSVVGTLITTDEDSDEHTYALESDPLAIDDNEYFTIEGDQLQVNAEGLGESESEYVIRVTSTDDNGNSFSQTLEVEVSEDVDGALPTDIVLSNTEVAEENAQGDLVGVFTTQDEDDESHTYRLVSGEGNDNNGRFNIEGDQLLIRRPLRLSNSPYSIRVRTTDGSGNTLEKVFAITVVGEETDGDDGETGEETDGDDETGGGEGVPTDINLTNNRVNEDAPEGTLIGEFSTEDEDSDEHTYSLVEGEVENDNEHFEVDDNQLKSAAVFMTMNEPTYIIRVQTQDNDGNIYAKEFDIRVTSDVLSSNSIDTDGITMFPNPFKSRLSLDMVNDYTGDIDISVYSMEGKLLMHKQHYKMTRSTRSMLDLKDLGAGVYHVKFSYGGREVTAKLIKD